MRNSILKEYLDEDYSIIPLGKNRKSPVSSWLWNQSNRASHLDVLSWTTHGFNLGIVTGRISKLVVLDVDNLGSVQELGRRVPETKQTASVKTPRGVHFYFESNRLTRTLHNNFLGLPGIDLQAERAYVVCPESKINNSGYEFIVPLAELLPYPERLVREETAAALTSSESLQYYTRGMACINQIQQAQLIPGQRDSALFVLYNQLIKARNTKAYSRQIISIKNQSLRLPLSLTDLMKVCVKDYRLTCSKVRAYLSFVNCDDCQYNERGQKMFLQIRHHSKLPTLTNAESRVLMLRDNYFDSQAPSATEISSQFNMDFRTVKKAIEGLKNKGIP